LAQCHDGFESPWLFSILEHILWCEPGYYIFVIKPHLFTITKDPYPIYCSVLHVAAANHFLTNDNVIPRIDLGRWIGPGGIGLGNMIGLWVGGWEMILTLSEGIQIIIPITSGLYVGHHHIFALFCSEMY
jgi:hypothetical protein